MEINTNSSNSINIKNQNHFSFELNKKAKTSFIQKLKKE